MAYDNGSQRALATAVLLTLPLFSCGPQWRELHPPDAPFTVQMPGEPTQSEAPLDTPVGPVGLECYSFVAGGEQPFWTAIYIMAYSDTLDLQAPQDVTALLDSERDRLILAAGATPMGPRAAKLLSERRVALGDSPGLALEVQHPGGRRARARIYFAAGRLYSLYASDTDEREDRFFSSFVLH
jgi:hypothetical protein